MDAMKQIKGTAGMQQQLNLELDQRLTHIPVQIDVDVVAHDADAKPNVPNRDHGSNNWVQWRSPTEDRDLDPKNEGVESLL